MAYKFNFEILFFLNIIFGLVISLFISVILSTHLSKKNLIKINLTFIIFTFLNTLILLIMYIFNPFINFEIILFSWVKVSNISINVGFVCDKLIILMLFVVTLISSLVHLYSIEYMRTDPNQIKFLQYLTLFTLSMCILVTANNFIQMFIGWEGVGVCSYLLINFWDTRLQANTSAMKAIIINRIGDINLIMAFVLIYEQFLSFDYKLVFILSNYLNINFYILLLLFFGAVGKSAQIFLHVWLPDAMEGPTPVSALIHAATMVTAGIFLIIKCSVLYDLSFFMQKLILIFGGLTALFAGSVGICQNDLKKIIAYSTCSQLGFMTAICGLGQYEVALFHLAMHAFFKALLFLSAGSIIHALVTEEQDIRRMGGLIFFMPVSYISILIGSLALMGFPFTAGFYSKDLILEHFFVTTCPISLFGLICCILASICTTIYSVRLIYFVFFTTSNISQKILSNVHESNFIILIPLIILNFFSIFGGFVFKSIFIENFDWLIEELPAHIKLFPTILLLFVSSITFFFFHFYEKFSWILEITFIRRLIKFLTKKWYFDIVFSVLVRKLFSFIFYYLFLLGDRGFLELMGPLGSVYLINFIKNRFVKYENLSLFGIFGGFVLGLIVLLLLIFVIFYSFN
jgi:proton-translocating NADH-quinone oxidoreductase chain L